MRRFALAAAIVLFLVGSAVARGGGHGGGGHGGAMHGGAMGGRPGAAGGWRGGGGWHGGWRGHHFHGGGPHVFLGFGFPYFYDPYYYYPAYGPYPPPPYDWDYPPPDVEAGEPPEAGGGGGEAAEEEPPASYGLVQLRGVPDGAAIDLDGRFWLTAQALGDRWLALPSGSHTIAVRVGDEAPVERRVAVDQGKTTVVRFTGLPRARS